VEFLTAGVIRDKAGAINAISRELAELYAHLKLISKHLRDL
jgi:hypothetical protein